MRFGGYRDSTEPRPIVELRRGATNGPVVLFFPHSGCAAAAMDPVAAAFPAAVRVLSIEYPGRGTRIAEPFAPDLFALATEIAASVEDDARLPLTVFGHSFGALVAFEVVRALNRMGLSVKRLYASSCPNPHVMASLERTVHQISDEQLVDLLVFHGGMSEELLEDVEMLDFVLPVIRNDTRLSELHRPEPGAMIGAPITAVGGQDDSTVSYEDLAGWGAVTTAEAGVVLLPGAHFHVLEHPHNIANLIWERLA